jgi:DNA-binding MarR family transcriptional regulator
MNFESADQLNELIRAIGLRHRALAISALAPFGIHPGHKLLLMELDARGPLTQAELAAATGYEPPTITLSVRQLETAKLVARKPKPGDQRATLVQLTDEGRRLVPKVKAAWRQIAEEAVGGLRSTPAARLTAVLEDLALSLSSAVGPEPDMPRLPARRTRA